MRVAILSLGARGDVQPYVALARGLLASGHSVILAAPERFRWLVEPYAVPWIPLRHDPLKRLRAVLESRSPTGLMESWRSFGESAIGAFDEWLSATEEADCPARSSGRDRGV